MSNKNTNERTQIIMNAPVYFGLAILETNKIVMFEFWCEYMKTKYRECKIMLHEYNKTFTYIFQTP